MLSGNYTAVGSCSQNSCEGKTFSCFDSIYKRSNSIHKECHEEMDNCPEDIIPFHGIDTNQNEPYVYILMKVFKVNSPF